MKPQSLTVLGATGSVGRSTLDVVRRHPDRIKVHALTALRDVPALLALCREFRPALAVLGDEVAAQHLQQLLRGETLGTVVRAGTDALCEVAGDTAHDTVMSAIVGAAGLMPTLAAVKAGKRVLIANKEPVVMAGRLLVEASLRFGATLIPIDSEHNAIFQCLPLGFRCGTTDAAAVLGVQRLVLTASGGPFRDTPLEDLEQVTPAQAVRHPNWVMGPKISVDSATMMNKGLELIEAHYLFGIAPERIEVVLHPESVIHSLVEYRDGSMLAQLGRPDMRVPIAHALAYPERWDSGVQGLQLAEGGRLNFQAVDPRRFPCLDLARDALRRGGIFPNVLNAANEIAVEAFLGGHVPFTGIAALIERTLEAADGARLPVDDSFEAVLQVDGWARRTAQGFAPGASEVAVGHA
ncbi:MAG TPA: 1-deoxy-D-xylulose-5-phosphate reductoisomerase [Verrucomicrobiae bacterium]|nr:1-deoxy-D-xylulose-5-phosphate reductoisomerase [Verrucomicrobiae bacterium]